MLQDYLSPVCLEDVLDVQQLSANQWGKAMAIYETELPNLERVKLAFLGVEEHGLTDKALPANVVREQLYQLFNWEGDFSAADLGNIKSGESPKDTHFAVRMVVTALLRQGIIPVIVGYSHELSYGQFTGHSHVQQMINVVMFDQKVDLFISDKKEGDASTFLYKMLTQQPHLSNFTHVGFQRYLVDPSMVDALEKLHFECYSLGEVRNNIKEVEPIIRNANMVSFDMSVLREADSPGVNFATPNGLWSEEACRISRYAGISDHVSSIGFYQFNPERDRDGQTAQLIAQMIWYFSEGFHGRKNESPEFHERGGYLKYIVNFKDNDYEITFLKSKKSDRWWMKVPGEKEVNNLKGYHLVPCSYADYEKACADEIPDRWMKAYLRLAR